MLEKGNINEAGNENLNFCLSKVTILISLLILAFEAVVSKLDSII